MREAPRILILNERDPRHPRAGGAEVHVTETFRLLVERGWQVFQASSGFRGGTARDEIAGIRVLRLGSVPTYYASVPWLCARDTRRGRYDLVVECLNKLPFWSPLYSAAPVLALCHHLFGTTAFRQASWPTAVAVLGFERMIPRLYRDTPFVAISESTRDDLVARGIAPERVRLVHPGCRRPDLELLPPSRRPRRVCYVGRLEPYKRVDVLIRAMARVAERFPDVELVIVGRGREAPRLNRVARAAGVAKRTRFVGFVQDAERDRLLATSRVCAYLSENEGWGISVTEAGAVGTPVIATDAPGLRDSVLAGRTGELVPVGDVASTAASITRLLADDTWADTLSEAALARSCELDWHACADAVAEAAERALVGR